MSLLKNYIETKADVVVEDVAHSLAYRRSMHRYRSFLIGNSQKELLKEFEAPTAHSCLDVFKQHTQPCWFHLHWTGRPVL